MSNSDWSISNNRADSNRLKTAKKCPSCGYGLNSETDEKCSICDENLKVDIVSDTWEDSNFDVSASKNSELKIDLDKVMLDSNSHKFLESTENAQTNTELNNIVKNRIISRGLWNNCLIYISDSFKNPLSLFCTCLFIILSSANVFFYVSSNKYQQSSIKAANGGKAKILAQTAANSLKSLITDSYLQTQEMAAAPFLTDSLLAEAWTDMQKYQYLQNNFLANAEGIDSFVVIDAASGDTIISGGTGTKTINNKYLDYYREVKSTGKSVVIPFRESSKTKIPYTYMAAPSFDREGNMLNIVRIRIKLAYIEDRIFKSIEEYRRINSELFDQDFDFYVVDNIGRIVATNASEEYGNHINDYFPSAESLRASDTEVATDKSRSDGSDYYLAYSTINGRNALENFDWSLFISLEKEDNNNRMVQPLLTFVLFEVVISFLIIFIYVRGEQRVKLL